MTEPPHALRVLLVDDHALIRAGLASLLRAWQFEVVGEAADGAAAVEAVRQLHPDVVFMDIRMPDMNGLEATRAIKAEWPAVRVVILTVSDDEGDLFEAVKSGAEGYLLKDLAEDEFEKFVEQMRRGEPVISPRLARNLLNEFTHVGRANAAVGAPQESGLTPRERDVLTEVARGGRTREVALRLGISENTVNFHLKNIFGKLHLRNRAEVVAWAVQRGYLRR
ncbi:MAG: response regulator transcription factor [Dehalococcoidia bacterium]|nr:MAG: response regulator transcription factor [Dehalococcoidia bacterium]